MDNNLIEYKLNLIQKMRLSISKRFVTLSSYAKYPDYLTQDEQIISQLLRKYQLQDIIKNEKLSDERKKTILKVADKSQILDLADEGVLNNDFIRYLYESKGVVELIPYLEENYILEEYKEGRIKPEGLAFLQKKPDMFKAKLIYIDAFISKGTKTESMYILKIENPDIQLKLFRTLKNKEILPKEFLIYYPELIGKMNIEEIQYLALNGNLYKILENMDYSQISKLNFLEKFFIKEGLISGGSNEIVEYNKVKVLIIKKE